MGITRHDVWQFIKFNIVGLSNTLVDFLAYTLLTQTLGVVYWCAQIISYGLGVLNSYLLNTRWTFREAHRGTPKQAGLFLLVNLVSLGVSLGVLALCKQVFGITSDMWAKVIATPVSILVNFLGNRLFVFRQKEKN